MNKLNILVEDCESFDIHKEAAKLQGNVIEIKFTPKGSNIERRVLENDIDIAIEKVIYELSKEDDALSID